MKGNELAADGQAAGVAPYSWLLQQKITIPDQISGYVDRPELIEAARPTRRPLTVLKASAGFGKTTLLSECCRRLRREGVATAWVSIDDRDEPYLLESYIAFACLEAGLQLAEHAQAEEVAPLFESRISAVVRELQGYDKPFVLAFDEVERLQNPFSVAVLEFLLQRAPPNLHLAMACREIPTGLNVAGAVMEGRAEVLGTEDMRFSKADVARFFELALSRKQLTREMDRSYGWPLAMRISRNGMAWGSKRVIGSEQDFVKNWIESRLTHGLSREDREFLFDLGMFEWFDAPLLDRVLERSDSARRLDSIVALEGLLEPHKSGEGASWRLHPLLREHCVRQRYRETPERFEHLSRRIAQALEGRGETLSAMRYASEAGDSEMVADIAERAGGARLWTHQGVVQLLAAERLLSDDQVAQRPRLALMRCAVLVLTGRMPECRKLYAEIVEARSTGEAREEWETVDHRVDDCFARTAMGIYGGDRATSDWVKSLRSEAAELTNALQADPLTRGHLEYGMCVWHQIEGDFDASLRLLAAARASLANSKYITLYGSLMQGQIDMAQGRIDSAESQFAKAKRIARSDFLLDPVPLVGCEITLKELKLECNREFDNIEPAMASNLLMNHGVPFSFFATASSLIIELRLRAGEAEEALNVATKTLNHLRAKGLFSFARYLAALRVSLLVITGELEAAERAWESESFPETADGCVDLIEQSWREMEAVSCARLRYLTAHRAFDEARDVSRALIACASGRRLRRTEMRALVLSIALEMRAGETESAIKHLQEFLALFAQSPYAWPLVQERAVCAPVLEAFLERHPQSTHRGDAQALLSAMQTPNRPPELELSEREREVLQRIGTQRDKEIAEALGLTVHGVRFHVRKIFHKFGVSNRAAAASRAQALGS